MVKSYREKRLAQGVTARTVNKEAVAFYQVLKLANDRGLISSLTLGGALAAGSSYIFTERISETETKISKLAT